MIRAQTLRAVGLAAGTLLLNDALVRANVPYGPSVAGALVIVLLAAQIGLGTVWVAIGGDPLLARVVVFLAICGGVWSLLANWHPLAESELAPACWVQGVFVVCVLAILRRLKFRLVRTGKDTSPAPLGPPTQFSIRDILILTTLIGVSLATLIRMGSLNVNRDAQIISCVLGVFLAAMTLVDSGSRHATVPAALTGGVSLLLGWGIGKAIHYNLTVSTLAIGGAALVQVAVLLAWRQAGYRFLRGESGSALQQAHPDHGLQPPFGTAS
jgi:hypothetical protein